MKNIFTLLSVLVLLLTNACKKEGCMDKEAENYDAKAKVESGNCDYNANQKAVMKLEGEWKVIAESLNDVPEDPSSYENDVYYFRNCSSKSTGCRGTFTYDDFDFGRISNDFRYSVSNNGKLLNISNGFDSQDFEILELSNVLRLRAEDWGDVYKVTMQKM